ncbi:response regulator [Azoarcus sp. KH32C]|uniref:response regulator n=1 Tax=Azoarcus sp. KH32C TaxID=748247 RepID=UPI0002386589|nr:response regulator [Azoarcus sp. KH32C]BAL22564.1 response regulator receiver protein [Azoarcus sp. KH32C]
MTANLPAAPPQRHLLLVDDEESILTALRRMLRRDGYVIHTAPGGAEGLEILAREPIGVVISDQRMPHMSGSEFLGKVKELHPETIRIVLSGYTELNSIATAINQGAIYKFLTKPWDDELLRGHIAEAFSHYEMKSENLRLAALNKAMIDAIPDAVMLVNSASRRVVSANAAAGALLGTVPEQLVGIPVADFEPLPQDQYYWDEIAQSGFRPMQAVETEYLTRDGEWVPVRKTTSNASDGANGHVLVLAHSLKHERAVESSLERINAEMASIFEATSEGLLVLDSEQRLTRMNRRLEAMWHFPHELLAAADGWKMLEWIAAQSVAPEQITEAFRTHLSAPDKGSSGTFVLRDGSTVRWYANPQLLGDEIVGNVFGFVEYHPPLP